MTKKIKNWLDGVIPCVSMSGEIRVQFKNYRQIQLERGKKKKEGGGEEKG